MNFATAQRGEDGGVAHVAGCDITRRLLAQYATVVQRDVETLLVFLGAGHGYVVGDGAASPPQKHVSAKREK
jgi:hypothetical protein